MVQIRKILALGKDSGYQKGIDYYNKCEYENALKEFWKLLENERNRGTLHYGLAEFYTSQSYRNLGIIAMHEARFKDAIKHFKKSLEILPEAVVLRNYLGICYNNIGLYNEAISEFKQVLAEKEDNVQVNVRLALSYYNKGEHENAIQRLKEAISTKPKHADLYYLLGLVLCNINDYNSGIAEFNRAIEINPLYIEAQRKLGLAYAALEKYKDAERVFSHLAKIAQEEDFAHHYLALACNILGEPEVAKKALREARELNPEIDMKEIGSKAASKHALADKAGEEFSKAIMISYTFTSILTPLESMVKDIGLYNTLVRIYKSILKDHPNYADFHHKLGQVYENLHKHRPAIDEFLKAIEINPDYMHAHTSLAFAYKEAGELDKAIKEFEFVVNRQAELPVAYFQLALLYKGKGDKPGAIELLNKALELQPDFQDAQALLKELYGK